MMSKAKAWSKYKGVCRTANGDMFTVAFCLNYIMVYTKNVKTKYEAAKIFDDLVDFYGLNRRKNFPDPEPENLIPNTRLIRLSKGVFAIVDDEDYEYLSQWKWCITVGTDKKPYAFRHARVSGKRTNIRMHREIVGDIPRGKYIDHIDHDTLNNRRSNLRICTPSQNLMNGSKQLRLTSSIYKGVSFSKHTGKWEAYIKINQKRIHLGLFIYEIDAARAYNQKAIELFGEFAYLNKI